MAAKAVDNIFKILESEKTMEARKNVAAEISIYSSSMIDDCRVQIGANSKANAYSSWTVQRKYTNW